MFICTLPVNVTNVEMKMNPEWDGGVAGGRGSIGVVGSVSGFCLNVKCIQTDSKANYLKC